MAHRVTRSYCSDFHLMQGAGRSGRARAQAHRERRKDWDHPHKVRRSIQFVTPILFREIHLSKRNCDRVWERGRYAHRLTPVSDTCVANEPEIKSLAQRVLKPFLAQNSAADDADCRVRLLRFL
jgi:hypothetical protein